MDVPVAGRLPCRWQDSETVAPQGLEQGATAAGVFGGPHWWGLPLGSSGSKHPLLVEQQGGDSDELGDLGQGRFVLLTLIQGVQVQMREVGEIPKDLPRLLG